MNFPRLCKNHLQFLERLTARKRRKGETISEDILLKELRELQGLKSDDNVFRTECVSSVECLTVCFKCGQNIPNKNEHQEITYSRREGELLWHKELQRSNQGFPETLAICRETDVPVRTVKRRTQFRRGMLRHIRDALKPLHNMILFKCNECKSRFPTWHPDFPCPLTKLRCLDACPIDVAPEDFDRKPEGENRFATFHTGICLRCRQSLEKVKDDAVLQGVSAFSARNNMDFVDGMDDENLAPDAAQSSLWDPLLVPDENRLRKEFYYLFENATVVEEMLVALNHMQVDVCYLRRTGLTGFRKNIISFPQDAVELKNFQTFWSNLKIGDIVNVLVEKGPPRRAAIRSLSPESLQVEYPESHSIETVDFLFKFGNASFFLGILEISEII